MKSSVSLGGYVPNLLVLLRLEQEVDKRRTLFSGKLEQSRAGTSSSGTLRDETSLSRVQFLAPRSVCVQVSSWVGKIGDG